jgi:hypothetical protein
MHRVRGMKLRDYGVPEVLRTGAGDTHDTHDTHGLHIGTYKFRLRTGYTELFVRNKLQVRALRDRA